MPDPVLSTVAPSEIRPGLWRIRNRGFASNTYVRVADDGPDCLVVDPGLDLEAILWAICSLEARPRAIVCTHGHFDHLASAAPLQQQFGIPLYVHRGDRKVVRSAKFLMMVCKAEGDIMVPTV